ncbi:NCS1 family nucleobase:cation symporter-1 [Acidihalobacter ferrooxydans]|uniref:Nitrate reductase n=1 Tax=Acidihalobacter ferrooxydans TaxID=1765967 RepID=A0A1P8UIW2_9GAMM|nr:NCS1 family nucleobase:cation symporter-1 [Acidihalobacter ferrooxydans]APZ43776.1 nitrate reductase [Acidihalobacter ferrooxydans]
MSTSENMVKTDRDPRLYNADLAPVKSEHRDWSWLNMSTVWMGMVHNVVAYESAAGLMALGLNAIQAIAAVGTAYFILFIVLWFNAKAGTKYGIPFCVLIRSSFGVFGANLPVIIRGFIAIFWFAVQGYAGSQAINAIMSTLWYPWSTWTTTLLGLSLNGWLSLGVFWALHALVVSHGVHRIRNFELIAGPLVIIVGLIATIWALGIAHGFGPIFAQPSKLHGMNGMLTFAIGVTGMIGIWSTFAVNIPDLTRFTKSQKDQVIGQLIGLPITAIVFTAMSVIVTSGTIIAFGKPIWDPVNLLKAINNPAITVLGGVTVIIATLSVNVAANIMPAAYDLVNLFPKKLTFIKAALLVLIIGLFFAPWYWFQNASTIFKVLGMIGGLLGPVTGIMLVDYFVVNKENYDVETFYMYSEEKDGKYGIKTNGVYALLIASVVALSGYFVPWLSIAADFSWFIGIGVGASLYWWFSVKWPTPYGVANQPTHLSRVEESAD